MKGQNGWIFSIYYGFRKSGTLPEVSFGRKVPNKKALYFCILRIAVKIVVL